jgi:hypothetical protein
VHVVDDQEDAIAVAGESVIPASGAANTLPRSCSRQWSPRTASAAKVHPFRSA